MQLEHLDLVSINIPNDSDVAPSTRWIFSVVPGISVYIENLIENEIPAPVCESKDGQPGMKYGVLLYMSSLYTYVRDCGTAIDWDTISRWDEQLFLDISAHYMEDPSLRQVGFPIPTPNAGFHSGMVHGRYRYSRIYCWTTDPADFSALLETVSQFIRAAAPAFISNGIDLPETLTVEVQTHYVYKDQIFDSKEDMRYAVRNEFMVKEAENAFASAFRLFRKKHIEHQKIGFIVDPEQSAFLFTLGNLKNDERNVFYTHRSEMISKWIALETDLDCTPHLHICDWLVWAIKRCLKKQCFKDMDNQIMLGMYGTDKETIFWIFDLKEPRKGLYTIFHYILSKDQIIFWDDKKCFSMKEDPYAFDGAALWDRFRR